MLKVHRWLFAMKLMQTVYNTVKKCHLLTRVNPTDQLPCRANGLTCDLIAEASQIMLLFTPCDSMRLTGKWNTAYFQSNVMNQNSGAQTARPGWFTADMDKRNGMVVEVEYLWWLWTPAWVISCRRSSQMWYFHLRSDPEECMQVNNDTSEQQWRRCSWTKVFSLDLMHNWNPFY